MNVPVGAGTSGSGGGDDGGGGSSHPFCSIDDDDSNSNQQSTQHMRARKQKEAKDVLRPGVVEVMQRHQVCYRPATSATSAVLSPATYEGESYLVLGLTGAAEVMCCWLVMMSICRVRVRRCEQAWLNCYFFIFLSDASSKSKIQTRGERKWRLVADATQASKLMFRSVA